LREILPHDFFPLKGIDGREKHISTAVGQRSTNMRKIQLVCQADRLPVNLRSPYDKHLGIIFYF